MRITRNGKTIGTLIGDTLVKRNGQVVKMNAMDGYGVAQQDALNPSIRKIRLETGGKVYKTTVGNLIKYGIPYHKPPYEPQWILPVNRWAIVNAKQTNLIKE